MSHHTRPAPHPWSASKLYRRSEANRRVLFLELVAWAIFNIEECATLEEYEAFEQELRDLRKREWGERPWSSATDAERFERHVLNMARGFTTADYYLNRKRQPAR